jgi:hypothetical protein
MPYEYTHLWLHGPNSYNEVVSRVVTWKPFIRSLDIADNRLIDTANVVGKDTPDPLRV